MFRPADSGEIIKDSVRADQSLTTIDMQYDIMHKWGFNVKYEKVWRGVEVARASLFGNYNDSFNELKWYTGNIMRTNSGSVVSLETEPVDNRFKRIFIAFSASIQGFKHWPPMLFVDETFMKSR